MMDVITYSYWDKKKLTYVDKQGLNKSDLFYSSHMSAWHLYWNPLQTTLWLETDWYLVLSLAASYPTYQVIIMNKNVISYVQAIATLSVPYCGMLLL